MCLRIPAWGQYVTLTLPGPHVYQPLPTATSRPPMGVWYLSSDFSFPVSGSALWPNTKEKESWLAFSITNDEVVINSSPWCRLSVATEKRWPLLTLWMWRTISFGSPVGLWESCHKKPRGCGLDKWLWADWQLWWRTGRPEVGHAKLDDHQSTGRASRKTWHQPPRSIATAARLARLLLGRGGVGWGVRDVWEW